jgi:oligopeptide/dipeptide ABC transporter ATP-binding protein
VTDSLLEVSNLRVDLSVNQRTFTVVDDVSLALEPSRSLALVGESGCGKTMTLRAIARLLPREATITGGAIRLRGEELSAMNADKARGMLGRHIGLIFQEPMTALNPLMRIEDQIAEGPELHLGMNRTDSRKRALELMEMVRIPDSRRRRRAYPHELSGGLRQRVMIAIALSCDPEILLCDEPTTALDVTVQDQILQLLKRLQEQTGVAIVFVTHDLAVVAEFCSRVAVMYAGQVVEVGDVAEVLATPRHPYTMGLLRSVPRLSMSDEPLPSIPGAPPLFDSMPPGCRFLARCPLASTGCEAEIPLITLQHDWQTRCINHTQVHQIDAWAETVGAGGASQ